MMNMGVQEQNTGNVEAVGPGEGLLRVGTDADVQDLSIPEEGTLAAMYEALDCHFIDCTRGDGFDVWTDDDAIGVYGLKLNLVVSHMLGRPFDNPILGPAVLAGIDETTGETMALPARMREQAKTLAKALAVSPGRGMGLSLPPRCTGEGFVPASEQLVWEAGHRCPVVFTARAWDDLVAWNERDADRIKWPQHQVGRLWDVLFLMRYVPERFDTAYRVPIRRVPRTGRSAQGPSKTHFTTQTLGGSHPARVVSLLDETI